MTAEAFPPPTVWQAQCCVVGAGPAGMMLGYLLARAGVDVIVLERHGDFLRDFRGDTIHPATTEVMAELGLLDAFLTLPHSEVSELALGIDGRIYGLVDFSRLPTRCRFMAFMPQWDFLSFLAAEAQKHQTFRLCMNADVIDLLRSGERVTGVRASTPEGAVQVRSPLTVACDGRWSVVRERAGLPVRNFAMPFDVLWFRLPRYQGAEATLGLVGDGQVVLAIDRGDYWQCGTVIPKDTFEQLRADGLDAFRGRVVRAAPFLEASIGALQSWQQIKLLSVRTDRLRRWYRDGLLCIGDAAHAMSPAGAAGVNYAIADAVATANALAKSLRLDHVQTTNLRRVQRRREPAVRWAQALQRRQNNQLLRLAQRKPPIHLIKLISHLPPIKRLLGRTIGLGIRREHIRMQCW